MASSKFTHIQENNWTCVVICLKKSAAILQKTVQDTLQDEINSWGDTMLQEFESLIQDIKIGRISVRYVSFPERQKRKIEDVWEIDGDHFGFSDHEAILQKILSMHTNRRNQNIQWNSDGLGSRSEPYWILAKIFMPFGNRDTSNPSEADPIALFDLVKNCILFKNMFGLSVIEKLCDARNAVMHSCDQRLTSKEKHKYIEQIEAFLDSPCFTWIPGVSEAKNIISAIKSSCIQLEPTDIDKLENEVREMFPNKRFNREELLEETGKLYQDYVSNGIKNLRKELEKDKRTLSARQATVATYKAIGGVTGASVIGSTGLAAISTVAVVASAPVAVPVVIVGGFITGFAAGLGYIGGRAGGGVIGLFRSITK